MWLGVGIWGSLVMNSVNYIGRVIITRKDLEGNIIDREIFKNQITNFALSQMSAAWSSQTILYPTLIAVGTGSPPAGQNGTSPTDTALWSELSGSRLTVSSAIPWLTYYTQFSLTYSQSQALGAGGIPVTFTEAGLFDSAGNLWSHVILNNVYHDNTNTISIQWLVLHQGN
jgi:hypothetical protein